jgi:hypothetical protein
MATERQTGVTRFELYSLLSTIFLFILLVHMSAAPASDNFLGVVNRYILMATLLALQLLCLFVGMWEQWRRPRKGETAPPDHGDE